MSKYQFLIADPCPGRSRIDSRTGSCTISGDAAEPAMGSDSPLRVRAISPSDGDAYRGILERTTEEDRYCRFFHIVNHFDLSDIKRFVDPRPDTIGVIAESGTLALGVAHIFFLSDESAEIAIVVARDARNRGVGKALLENIVELARTRRLTTLIAYAFSLNSAFSHLAHSVGMTPAGSNDETVTWTLALAPH